MWVGGGGGCIGQRLRLALAQMRSELEELRAEQSLSIILNNMILMVATCSIVASY